MQHRTDTGRRRVRAAVRLLVFSTIVGTVAMTTAFWARTADAMILDRPIIEVQATAPMCGYWTWKFNTRQQKWIAIWTWYPCATTPGWKPS